MAIRLAGAAALAAALSSAALREQADAGPESAARESLRPVLATAFADSGAAWRRGAGAPEATSGDAPPRNAASRDGAPGSPERASEDPASDDLASASGDKPPRWRAPRGPSRPRITSPGF